MHYIADGCEKLAKKSRSIRDNNIPTSIGSIAQNVHWALAKKNGFEVSQKLWESLLEENGVIENNTAEMRWKDP